MSIPGIPNLQNLTSPSPTANSAPFGQSQLDGQKASDQQVQAFTKAALAQQQAALDSEQALADDKQTMLTEDQKKTQNRKDIATRTKAGIESSVA